MKKNTFTEKETRAFYGRLYRAMEVRGETTISLSRKTGVHRRVFTYTGHIPYNYSIIVICKALNVSADYLFGLKEEM